MLKIFTYLYIKCLHTKNNTKSLMLWQFIRVLANIYPSVGQEVLQSNTWMHAYIYSRGELMHIYSHVQPLNFCIEAQIAKIFR